MFHLIQLNYKNKQKQTERKRLMKNIVEAFDLITLIDRGGREKTFRVKPLQYEQDKQYINLKLMQRFIDNRGHKWQVVRIEKNNKYIGLSSALPKMYSRPDGVVAKWKGGPSRQELRIKQEYRMGC